MKERAKCMLFVVLFYTFVASLEISKLVDGIWPVVCGIVGGICAVSIWELLRSDKKSKPKVKTVMTIEKVGDVSVEKVVTTIDGIIVKEIQSTTDYRPKSDEVEVNK